MSKKSIIIDFDENGNPNIDGQGFVGTECSKFLSEIQVVLGEQINKIQKPEYRLRAYRINKTIQSNKR